MFATRVGLFVDRFRLLLLADIVLALWVINAVFTDLGKTCKLSGFLTKVETTTVAVCKTVLNKIKQAVVFVWGKIKQGAEFIKTKTAKLVKKGEHTAEEEQKDEDKPTAEGEQQDGE